MLAGSPQTTKLWLPKDQAEDRKHQSPDTTILPCFCISPAPVTVQHWGLLHSLSNGSWVSCCLQPKRRMKVLGQYGGMQTSCLARKGCSGHEKAVLKKQGHRGRADDPVSILWTTPWCPSATPAGRTWCPRSLQISRHAESLPEVPPWRSPPWLSGAQVSQPEPSPQIMHPFLPSLPLWEMQGAFLPAWSWGLLSSPKAQPGSQTAWTGARHLASLRAESLPQGEF